MLGRSHRFHGHNSLNYVYRSGNSFRSELLSLKVAPNTRRHEYRCAVVVSKKVSKSAVTRNRIRRRIYESIRGYSAMINEPFDIVVTVFSEEVATLSTKDLDNTLGRLFMKAKIVTKTTTSSHATIEPQEN